MNGASTEQRWRKQRKGTMEDDRGVKYKGFPPFCLWTKYIVGIWHFVYRFVMKPACYLTTALYLCIYLLHCKRRSICSLPLEKGTIEVCVCVLLFFEGEEECRVLVQPYSLTQTHLGPQSIHLQLFCWFTTQGIVGGNYLICSKPLSQCELR